MILGPSSHQRKTGDLVPRVGTGAALMTSLEVG